MFNRIFSLFPFTGVKPSEVSRTIANIRSYVGGNRKLFSVCVYEHYRLSDLSVKSYMETPEYLYMREVLSPVQDIDRKRQISSVILDLMESEMA